MALLGNVTATAIAFTMTASIAFAQADAIPAEFPPASFTGNQYVDSNGCAFIRAGIGGAVNWVPRLTRSREQMCNFQPTFAKETASEPPVVDEMTEEAPAAIVAAPAPAVEAKEPAAPIVAATPVPKPVAPRVAPKITKARPAPAPTPRIITPKPAPAPAQVTMAQACAGRYGIQTGFVSARTGKPINCGPVPKSAPIGTVAGIGVNVTSPKPAPERITMAELCARAAAGTRFVRQDGTPVRCNHKTSVSTFGNIPASNPVPPPPTPKPPKGYEKVWTDGRINPQRGKVASAARVTQSAPVAHRYVQVGTFGVPANAERMMKRLHALGYPVATARAGHLRIIAAGPFSTQAEVHNALKTARNMGFNDAFTRN